VLQQDHAHVHMCVRMCVCVPDVFQHKRMCVCMCGLCKDMLP